MRAALGAAAPIARSTDMRALRSCDLIVAATNAPHPVITTDHLGEGAVVVCDVATPGDVDPAVTASRPDVTVVNGGMVRLPLGQSLSARGMPVPRGIAYGCLGETILMGLAGVAESLSLGALTVSGVRRARDLALLHGFSFDDTSVA
jgi:predicted amino acid dehydrogenase